MFRLSEVGALIRFGLKDGPILVLLEVLAPKAAQGEVCADDEAEGIDSTRSSVVSVVFDC